MSGSSIKNRDSKINNKIVRKFYYWVLSLKIYTIIAGINLEHITFLFLNQKIEDYNNFKANGENPFYIKTFFKSKIN